VRRLAPYSYAAGPLFITTVLFVANVILEPAFVQRSDWAATLTLAAPFILTGLAQTFPIMTGNGGLDLSVGPLAGFCSVLVASVIVPHGIHAAPLVVPLIIGFGLAAGAVNGVLVAYLRIPPIIATLGAYLFYSGLASQLMPTPGGEVPGWLIRLVGSYGPVPGTLILFAVVTLLWLLLSRTAYVRNLLAVGGDDRVAFTAGVKVAAVKVSAYAFAGGLAALAGLVLTGSLQSADATVGASFTISSIAAVALGGVSLAGGRGGLLGAALGGASFYLIQNLLTAASVSVFQLDIANGAIMIAALALSAQLEVLRKRRGRVEERPDPAAAAPLVRPAG
jgi:ribose transport system permease protein